jgi:hypothetical protein
MQSKKSLLFLLLVTWFPISSFAQATEEAFKPSGKPEVRLFTNFNSAFRDGDVSNKFEITRAYFGYSYSFSKTISGRVTFDIGNPGGGSKNPFVGMLKFAYVQYQKNNLTANLGMIGSNQFEVQERLWGYRYIYKSLQDEHGFGPSTDLGLSLKYKLSKQLSADFMLVNGEGFRVAESDSALKVGIGATWQPTEAWTIRGYYDNMTKKSKAQQTYAFVTGYTHKKFNLNAEYNYQKENGMISGHDFWGYSFYGTVNLKKNFKFFARYDNVNSKAASTGSTGWNIAKDGKLYHAGFEYTPVNGVKISPNFQGWDPAQQDKSFISKFYISLELKI